MICYIDMEHDSWLAVRQQRLEHYGLIMDVKLKLEALAGRPCLVRRYCDVSQALLSSLGVRAVVISGNATAFDAYGSEPFAAMQQIIRAAEQPIIGFCGGHQLIALTHGAEVGPIRRLRAGEPDQTDLSGPGYLKEWGFTPVTRVAEDPLFEGLGPTPTFLEMHYWEAKQVPEGFRLLASTENCRVQAMRRVDRLVYGTQFHPEAFTEWPQDDRNEMVNTVYLQGYAGVAPDGRTLLGNFFRLAGVTA